MLHSREYFIEICGSVQPFRQFTAKIMQSILMISEVTGPMPTKFLSDVEESLPVLTRLSALRSSRALWNANAENEGGVCQFLLRC